MVHDYVHSLVPLHQCPVNPWQKVLCHLEEQFKLQHLQPCYLIGHPSSLTFSMELILDLYLRFYGHMRRSLTLNCAQRLNMMFQLFGFR